VANAPCSWREWGKLFANRRECRETDKRSGVGPQEIRPQADGDLEAVRTGIGTAMRAIHSDVLSEQVPDRMTELLTQLDQQKADTA
jgi:Anti-sigma factor NepR